VRANRIRKSVGAKNTFARDLTEFEPMAAEMLPLIDKVWRHCESTGARGRTATLKVKFSDFELIFRSRSAGVIYSQADLASISIELLESLMPLKKPVRLLGISVSNFVGESVEDNVQLPLSL
jgi:DNA polymerase-4